MENRYLFRAKRIDNGEWIVGSLIQTPYLGSIRSWISSEQEDKARLREISSNQAVWRAFEVRTDTICQCSGRIDMYGNLIFEHDIVREQYSECIGEVKFGEHEKGYGWYIEWISEKAKFYRVDFQYWQNEVSIEVIGNIFDNPELLEVGE